MAQLSSLTSAHISFFTISSQYLAPEQGPGWDRVSAVQDMTKKKSQNEGDAQYTKSIYALLSRPIVWSPLCYSVRNKDHCCVLCDVARDLLLTWYIVHQPKMKSAGVPNLSLCPFFQLKEASQKWCVKKVMETLLDLMLMHRLLQEVFNLNCKLFTSKRTHNRLKVDCS